MQKDGKWKSESLPRHTVRTTRECEAKASNVLDLYHIALWKKEGMKNM